MGTLCIVIATIAFGVGLDCPNVRQVIYLGSPSDVEDYLQQSGRAGQDGKSSLAVLYFSKKDFAFSSGTSMNAYCVNEEKCR